MDDTEGCFFTPCRWARGPSFAGYATWWLQLITIEVVTGTRLELVKSVSLFNFDVIDKQNTLQINLRHAV